MKEFELGHAEDIGISKSKIFEMKRPKLEYAENCTLIHTYARKLEEYCDYLEECNNVLCEDMENLRESLDYELQVKTEKIERLEKALDKACEELEELDKCHSYEINKQIVEKKGSSTITFGYQNKEEWKEWCMKDE